MRSICIPIVSLTLVAALLTACNNASKVEVNSNANTNTTHDMTNMNGHDMSNMSNHDMSSMMPASAPDAAKQPYDLQFIDTMIVHHEGAIKMSQMVLSKSEKAELKAFAQKIIDDQTKEMAQLKQWREQWFPGKPSALNMEMAGMMNQGMKIMNGEHMKEMDEMEPSHFDNHFLTMMTLHHQGAIDMAKEALSKAEHKEIKDLCNRIISAQSSEIDQMKTWQKKWKE